MHKVSVNASYENNLEQNNPNPFSDKTTINYSISSHSVFAQTIIRNLSGAEMKRINLEKSKTESVTIEGSQFVQGTYTLEINGKSIDPKLMVNTK